VNKLCFIISLLISLLGFQRIEFKVDEAERQRQEQMDMRALAREDDQKLQDFLYVIRQIE
jgi:hypothetical protein